MLPVGALFATGQPASARPQGPVGSGVPAAAPYEPVGAYVTAVYEDLFGRVPDPGGLAHWLTQMRNGMHIQQMEAGFLASPEYYGRAGGADSAEVRALYEDVLPRPHSWPTRRQGAGDQRGLKGEHGAAAPTITTGHPSSDESAG